MSLGLTVGEWAALWLSLQVAAWCVVLLAVPGVAVGWLLARREFPGKALFDALVHLPLVLPPVVVGYLLLVTFGRRGWLGAWLHDVLGVEIAFTWMAAVLASAVVAFPLMVRAVRLSMELSDRGLEQTARTLGAGPWRTFATITLPLALPGILAGVTLAFARSLGEFGATITFAGNVAGQTQTLPLAVYTYTQSVGGDAPAIRLVIVSVVLSLIALVASETLARRVKRALERR